MLLLTFLLACAPAVIMLDTAADAAAVDDTGTADTGDRPCAFIDDWVPEMHLPAMTLYRYDLTGCGVVNGCTCADATIANAGLTSAAWLDGSQGDVELVVNAWVAGTTTCTCEVVDYDHYDDYSASYVVSVESTE